MLNEEEKTLVLVVSTFPSMEAASRICKGAVEGGLAACANLIEMRSFFIWEGEMEDVEEVIVFIKSSRSAYESLRGFIRDNHPYSVPEILALRVDDVNKPYLEWVLSQTLKRRLNVD